MFTGIIEHSGIISRLDLNGASGKITVHAPLIAGKVSIAASIAVNGCCLTVVHRDHESFSADMSGETLAKTSFASLKTGMRVNLEQPLTAGKEFGGHFVLGHVDATGRVEHLKPEGENWWYGVEVPAEIARYVVSKGSITIDGISLTVARWKNHIAEVAIIPYTYTHTNIRDRVPGDVVNLEADILGKYIERYTAKHGSAVNATPLRVDDLIRQGF